MPQGSFAACGFDVVVRGRVISYDFSVMVVAVPAKT